MSEFDIRHCGKLPPDLKAPSCNVLKSGSMYHFRKNVKIGNLQVFHLFSFGNFKF